jgi:hypothetical protein
MESWNRDALSLVEGMARLKAQREREWEVWRMQQEHLQQLELERQRQAGRMAKVQAEYQKQRDLMEQARKWTAAEKIKGLEDALAAMQVAHQKMLDLATEQRLAYEAEGKRLQDAMGEMHAAYQKTLALAEQQRLANQAEMQAAHQKTLALAEQQRLANQAEMQAAHQKTLDLLDRQRRGRTFYLALTILLAVAAVLAVGGSLLLRRRGMRAQT